MYEPSQFQINETWIAFKDTVQARLHENYKDWRANRETETVLEEREKIKVQVKQLTPYKQIAEIFHSGGGFRHTAPESKSENGLSHYLNEAGIQALQARYPGIVVEGRKGYSRNLNAVALELGFNNFDHMYKALMEAMPFEERLDPEAQANLTIDHTLPFVEV